MNEEPFEVVSQRVEKSREDVRPSRRPRFSTLIVALIALSLGFGLSTLLTAPKLHRQDFQIKTSGLVSMSEEELISVANEHDQPIYWSGPIPGYRYILTIDRNGSSTLKYLSESQTAGSRGTREIATYIAKTAWDDSLLASVKDGMSSFKNADGSLVFYATAHASDVFMAFENKGIQVEVFDDRAGQALSLALLAGQIRPVVSHESG